MGDPADDAPIILPLRPGMDHRKMRRERRKLFVCQPKIVRHESSPPYGLESRQTTQFNWVHTLGGHGTIPPRYACGLLAPLSASQARGSIYSNK
jgi:hypothetical protein